jgi:hypothetical protein
MSPDTPSRPSPARGEGSERLAGRGRSSVGRAPQSHCGGQGFESPRLHQDPGFKTQIFKGQTSSENLSAPGRSLPDPLPLTPPASHVRALISANSVRPRSAAVGHTVWWRRPTYDPLEHGARGRGRGQAADQPAPHQQQEIRPAVGWWREPDGAGHVLGIGAPDHHTDAAEARGET